MKTSGYQAVGERGLRANPGVRRSPPQGRDRRHAARARIALAALAVPLLIAVAGGLGRASALTGEEILKRVDENTNFSTISYDGTLAIHSQGTVRTKEMKVIAMGVTKALVEFTNSEDFGTKYLKIDKNLWIYFPSEQDTVRISGNMLKQGMMGSDVSYEDALDSDPLYRKYSVSVTGTETVDGRPCYVLTLTATARDVQYDKRKIWVDEERFVPLRQDMYAQSGKLLKVFRTLEVRKIEGRYFPVKSEVVDELKADSRTVFAMREVRFNVPVDPGLFSLRNLGR